MAFRFCSAEDCTLDPVMTIQFREMAADFCEAHGLEVVKGNPLWTSVTKLEARRATA